MVSPEQRIQHALQLAQTGKLPEAVALLRQLTAQAADLPLPRFLLALLLHQSGASRAALAEIDQALRLEPANPAMGELKATLLAQLGPPEAAEALARQLLADSGDRPQVWLCLGTALQQQKRLAQSAAALRSALALRADFAPARRLLIQVLLQQGQDEQALETASAAGFPDDAAALDAVDDFLASGALDQALALLHRFPQPARPGYERLVRIARLLHQRSRSSEALAWSEAAHALRPDALEPQEMRAVSLIDRGDVEAGLALYATLQARSDFGAESANRRLILSHYDPAQDTTSLFAAHTDWIRRYAPPFGTAFVRTQSADAGRRLRIGWISPRFNAGPVTSFLTDTLAAFDRENFQHVLVSLSGAADEATAGFRAMADTWLDARGLDDESLLQRLREQQFDIAVDLAGHSFGNRLRVLAQRVAPVQLCWLDYFNTTGLAAMDGWISDEWLTPADSPQRYVETLHRLHSGRFCYSPPAQAPLPDHAGSAADAPVFVSFNRLAKLNDGVLDAWAEILRRVPDARLELGAGLLGDAQVRAHTVERFSRRGIDAQRLRLHAKRSYADLLAAYRHADIALDPFPFSGCTTTADALWMGAAVITLPGSSFVSRQSASLLQRLGRAAWVAPDIAGYVAQAVAMAQHVDELRATRTQLRSEVRRRLCDAAAQAAEMGALFRWLWRDSAVRQH
ncbi:O-linked N-acetylglucosamine transferase, SPINDLY family protein [Tahibacter harae]|uniref:protein O-GlcNAc transferase n=1 Tax=Tahibacter harae TaxID=2963937 RepID=A0ABT1QTR4_9GAMM|nr:hypothetical protein [Tahibacter harae]MCQ4165664.1 hypothetical protein [Tahibacter harae]